MMPQRPMTNEELLYWMQTGQIPPTYMVQPMPQQQVIEPPPPPQPNPLYAKVQQNWQEKAAEQAAQEEQQQRAAVAQGIGSGISAVGSYMLAKSNPIGAILTGVGNLFGFLGGK